MTADTISDLPQPHHSNTHSCEICEELRMHADEPAKAKEIYNNPMERYRTSRLLDAARDGCCFSSICIQAAAGFVKNPVANALSMVKTDPDEQFRFAIYTGEPDTIIELYEHPGKGFILSFLVLECHDPVRELADKKSQMTHHLGHLLLQQETCQSTAHQTIVSSVSMVGSRIAWRRT